MDLPARSLPRSTVRVPSCRIEQPGREGEVRQIPARRPGGRDVGRNRQGAVEQIDLGDGLGGQCAADRGDALVGRPAGPFRDGSQTLGVDPDERRARPGNWIAAIAKRPRGSTASTACSSRRSSAVTVTTVRAPIENLAAVSRLARATDHADTAKQARATAMTRVRPSRSAVGRRPIRRTARKLRHGGRIEGHGAEPATQVFDDADRDNRRAESDDRRSGRRHRIAVRAEGPAGGRADQRNDRYGEDRHVDHDSGTAAGGLRGRRASPELRSNRTELRPRTA